VLLCMPRAYAASALARDTRNPFTYSVRSSMAARGDADRGQYAPLPADSLAIPRADSSWLDGVLPGPATPGGRRSDALCFRCLSAPSLYMCRLFGVFAFLMAASLVIFQSAFVTCVLNASSLSAYGCHW